MDDYKQPDMLETSDEVEMLLDEQTVQAEQAANEESPDVVSVDTVSSDAASSNQASSNVAPDLISDVASETAPKDAQLEDIQLPETNSPEKTTIAGDIQLAQETKETGEGERSSEQTVSETEQPSEQSKTEGESLEQPATDSDQPENVPQSDVQIEPQSDVQSDTQSSVNPSVTLNAIHDSETVKTVNLVKQLLNDLDEAQKDKTRLTSELKQSEKAYSSMEKSVAEGITTALKKKKEEIAATYDRELSQYQDQIDACKTERAKAKANAIAQRIQIETAPLNQQNQQLEAQIELKFKENKVPVVCKKRAISMLFFPKNSHDWTVDILVGIGLLFIVPLFFTLAIQNRLVLAFSFFVYAGALFAAYLYLLHKYMLKFAHVNDEVEELRKQIRVNNKNKQLMTNRIKKSQDETGYNLGGFDDKIAGIQQVMQDTVAKRQEALENFESEIRHQITADITAANKDELLGLQQAFEDKRKELSDKKDEIEQIEKLLKEEYEPVFGKDLLYKQRLNKFDSFCQENADLSMEEALTQYRALSGSKLLKK